MFLFFVYKCQFWSFQKFANFRIKKSYQIIPTNDFPWKKESDLHYLYLKTLKIVKKSEIFLKFLEIAEEHTFRSVNFLSNCAALDKILYFTIITQFRPKFDLGRFENELTFCVMLFHTLYWRMRMRISSL